LEKKATQKCAFLTFSNDELLKLFVRNFSNSVVVFEIVSFGRISRFSLHRSYKSVMYLLEKKNVSCTFVRFLNLESSFTFMQGKEPHWGSSWIRGPDEKSVMSTHHSSIHDGSFLGVDSLLPLKNDILNRIVPSMLGNGKLTVPIKLWKSWLKVEAFHCRVLGKFGLLIMTSC
jgi:hypothetical protein